MSRRDWPSRTSGMIRSISRPNRCSISSSRSVAHIGNGLPEEALLGNILESLHVPSNLLRHGGPMMPHDVIIMHLIACIVGESARFELIQGNLVPLGKRADFALREKKPFL